MHATQYSQSLLDVHSIDVQDGQHAEKAPLITRGLFAKDLKDMLYGFGDAEEPYTETVDAVEDIVVDYITTLIQKVLDNATGKGGKPTTEDLLYLIRKDIPKYNRAKELLTLNEEIRKARRNDGEMPLESTA